MAFNKRQHLQQNIDALKVDGKEEVRQVEEKVSKAEITKPISQLKP